jgi:hypothetical protein
MNDNDIFIFQNLLRICSEVVLIGVANEDLSVQIYNFCIECLHAGNFKWERLYFITLIWINIWNKGNAKRGVSSPHLKIGPCDFDLENQYGSRFS